MIQADAIREYLTRHGTELGWILLGHAAAFIGGIAGVKILTVTLGPGGYGSFALGLSIAGLLTSFVHNPVSNAVARYLAVYRERGQTKLYLETMLTLQGRLALFSFVVLGLALLLGTVALGGSWGILLAAGIAYGAANGAGVIFLAWQNAARDRRRATLAQIADVWLRISIAIMLIRAVNDSRLAVVGYAVGSLLVALWQWYKARCSSAIISEALAGPECRKQSHREFLRFSLPFCGYAVFTVVSLYGDRWILQEFSGLAAVGIYAALYQLAASPVNILFAIVNQLMIPLVYERAGGSAANLLAPAARRMIRGTVLVVTILLMVGSFLLYPLADWLVGICTSALFVPSASLLVVLFWGLGLFQLAQLLTLYGNCAGRPGIYVSAKVVHAATLALLGCAWVPHWGAFGMGWALVASSASYFVVVVLLNMRFFSNKGEADVQHG